MAAVTDVSTVPPKRWITQGESDVWAVDFANQLGAGESVSTTVSARVVRTLFRDEVAGFVTSATKSGTTVVVAWDASVLSPGIDYRLETTARLNTGVDRVLVTDLVVV